MAEVITKSYIEYLLGERPSWRPITIPAETKLTYEKVVELVELHQTNYVPRFNLLEATYEDESIIFAQDEKPVGKPDNRLAVNHAKYLVDTMNGYFIGNPIKTNHDDEEKNEYIRRMNIRNNQDDIDAEIAKDCSKFGTSFELLYQNDEGEIGTSNVSPQTCFVVYDDTVLMRPLWGIRYDVDDAEVLRGSVSTESGIQWFMIGEPEEPKESDPPIGELSAVESHSFGRVPIVQYRENDEYHSLFESVLNLTDAYNKALSEKSNDVDYYADAYMKILGPRIDEENLGSLRDHRILNFEADGDEAGKFVVEFMAKPESDQTQENLIDRLDKLIFQIAMIADISDESFYANASGVALKYKLQGMSNLAMVKERKFKASLIDKYKMICGYPKGPLVADDLYEISFTFTRNLPIDLNDEADTAVKLSGVVSKETQLGTLSFVPNPTDEIQKIEQETMSEVDYLTEFSTDRVPAQTSSATLDNYRITSIMNQLNEDGSNAEYIVGLFEAQGGTREQAQTWINRKLGR